MFLTITWASEVGIHLGPITLRYYSLLFVIGFALGYRMMRKWFADSKISETAIDTLLTYMVVATVVGARLGHCLFYAWDYYSQNPLEILYVWKGGLASHGAAIAIPIAMFLFAKKVINKPFLWMMDRLVITVALAGAFIRIGNWMNSEIYGDPSNSTFQTVFAQPVIDVVESQYGHLFTHATLEKSEAAELVTDSLTLPAYRLVVTTLEGTGMGELQSTWQTQLRPHLSLKDRDNVHFIALDGSFFIPVEGQPNTYSVEGYGIPRHPSQWYEALAYFAIFGVLYWLFSSKGWGEKEGKLFGLFLVLVFGARFFIEFLKANQSSFESVMAFNRGQQLSIPFVLIGLFLLIRSTQGKNQPS